MNHNITLIKGDGIGAEVTQACVAILEAAKVGITWDVQPLGLSAIELYQEALPKQTLLSIQKNKVALKGPTTTPLGLGHQSANVLLRKNLDLYACIRPIKSIEGLITRYNNVDLVIFRENTEGLYCGQELEIQPGVVVSLRLMTKIACERIIKKAFDFAIKNNRKKVCLAHKANILKKGDGLLLNCFQEIKKEYPDIIAEEMIIDALCMKMVMNPNNFDVIVLENMFGDILSDLASGFIGGLGIAPGANIGTDYAVFEPVHGSADDIKGLGIANPTACLKSAILMLEHIKEYEKANLIDQALIKVLQKKDLRTKDLGGNASTEQFVKSIIEHMNH